MSESVSSKPGRSKAARARTPETVGYRVNVIGIAWAGYQATYTYPSNTMPADDVAVGRLAGDFQDMLDYQVERHGTRREIKGRKLVTIQTVEVVRDWARPESEDTWLCATA